MLFNSFEFLLFLPVVFILYWFVFNKKLAFQNGLILLASYFFYGWWSWKFMLLLLASTAIDYGYGFGVASDNKRRSRIFLWLSILNNLGILCLFKYYDFFAIEFQQVFAAIGIHFEPILLKLALPIGISFYTFHGMSYVFDIYRGSQKPVRNFIDYAVFVSFFPLLVAGPIERAGHLLPQVCKPRIFSKDQAKDGCSLILWGMFKKVIIADSLAGMVDEIFVNYQTHSATTLMIGAVSFSFQIYCDFSGYSDIALGTAKLFGFELLSNFKFPYFARDLAEFWRRWHISLSSWFRDYLYIPLGGSRSGKTKAVVNTFIIFIVSGFWHGASWNFIVWGFIHACGFIPLLLLDRNRKNIHEVTAQYNALPSIRELIQMCSTFLFVTIAWVFFRAEDLSTATAYVLRIFEDTIIDPGQLFRLPEGKMAFLYIIPLICLDWRLRRNERQYHFYKVLSIGMTILVLLYLLKSFGMNASFIYFQF